ncbi:MAG: ATP-dependent DNA ligase [Actinomycetota bacterium]|nr:ATP-dependent DNA ligase [Actinomycetota bacterium]
MSPARLAPLVATSGVVASTTKRGEKVAALAELIASLAPGEARVAVAYLAGEAPQGRIGIGWATISAAADATAASEPSLTIAEVDAALDRLAATSGPGSQKARVDQLRELFGRATAAEADFLRRLLIGELRQGALEGLMADAVAKGAGVPLAATRRAAMLHGDLAAIAEVALASGEEGLAAIGLEIGRGLKPMLASPAESPADTLAGGGRSVVEWKLDGARIQVHRRGGDVVVYTRNLNDVTERMPEVVATVLDLDASDVVLDGEALLLDPGRRPVPFQETMSRFGRETVEVDGPLLVPFFFDVLHLDGDDLLDLPLDERRSHLAAAVPEGLRVPGTEVTTAEGVSQVLAEALSVGHEGVVVKDPASRYEAGRRGAAWRKLKPSHTLDLVVLAAEWGHGRRQGWLSNLHLGARDPGADPDDPAGGFVMLGKTFKGLTDELLTWQTAELLAREVSRDRHVVHVRPELVVEIALDGVQTSTRYPGGMALRFARVKRYRPDKDAAEADTVEVVRAIHEGRLPT